jgi:Rad3-related DNA helicase
VDYRALWDELLPVDNPRLDEAHRVPFSHEEATGADTTEMWEHAAQRQERDRAIDEELRRQELEREKARVYALWGWVAFQQRLHAKGKLKQVRQDALREIGFDLGRRRAEKVDDENSSWWKSYRQLATALETGEVESLKIKRAQPRLYSWLTNARHRYRSVLCPRFGVASVPIVAHASPPPP